MCAASEALYLYAYPDPAHGWKIPTIGCGHTAAAGGLIPVRGMKITLSQACAILMQDLNGRYGPRVERAIKRRLMQHVFDGFTSFDLNTGAILNGTVDDRWNAGDEAEALDVLRRYVNAGGKRLAGLVTRRILEARLISDGLYPSAMVLVRTSPDVPGRMVQASSLPWGSEAGPTMIVAPNTIVPAMPAPMAPSTTTTAPRASVWTHIQKWWNS